jgi:hypothetical protein
MIHTPEMLRRAIEKLYTDVTEPLDPYVALALTNLSVKMAETAYLMGFQDGRSASSNADCDLCHGGECLGLGLGKAF